jgi:hypothetical protein
MTVAISKATTSKVVTLFKQVGFHQKVYDGPGIAAPVTFAPFDWGQRDVDTALPDARTHIEIELRKFGVPIGHKNGYAVEDVHKIKDLLTMSDEKVGAISGGSDVAVVPFQTAKSGLNACICVLFEIKTFKNVSNSCGGLKRFEAQAHVELLASRCLLDQPGVWWYSQTSCLEPFFTRLSMMRSTKDSMLWSTRQPWMKWVPLLPSSLPRRRCQMSASALSRNTRTPVTFQSLLLRRPS